MPDDINPVIGTTYRLSYSITPLADANAATIAGHDWTQAGNAQSSESTNTRNTNTVTVRLNGGTQVPVGGGLERGLSVEILEDANSTLYRDAKAAIAANSPMAFADTIGDPAASGVTGEAGNFLVSAVNRSSGDGASTISLTMAPTTVFNGDYIAP